MTRRSVFGAIVMAAFALAGCGSADGNAASTHDSSPGSPSIPLPTKLPTPEPISLSVRTAKVNGKDVQFVTGNGWTLYRFEADIQQPSRSICVFDCLEVWPPLVPDGSEVKVDGIDRSLVGSIQRPDGFTQLTLGGWPLYRFHKDKTKSDVEGENAGGNWSLVDVTGKAVFKKGPIPKGQ
ncbi:hypothetical protein ACQPXM_11630 [Kribbella sp. CA-253562]|uniref:hypothetical protein n=1 Tax=Kribbella sp. CA-253562 TaxID=3239942 RepID=UPI003D907100